MRVCVNARESVNVDHASLRARDQFSLSLSVSPPPIRRLSLSTCAARLSVLIRRPLFVAVSLRCPGQRTPTCTYLSWARARGLVRISGSVYVSSKFCRGNREGESLEAMIERGFISRWNFFFACTLTRYHASHARPAFNWCLLMSRR